MLSPLALRLHAPELLTRDDANASASPSLHNAIETALYAGATPEPMTWEGADAPASSSLHNAMETWWNAASAHGSDRDHGPLAHIRGQPSILFAVMTGAELHEERAEPVLRTWCGDVQACIFFSDALNGKRWPATCEPPRAAKPSAPTPYEVRPAALTHHCLGR